MRVVELKDPVPANLPRRIEVEDEPRRGGEGEVYFSRDGMHAVKIYYRPRPDKERLLLYVMEIFRSLRQDQERFILPPLALVETLDGVARIGFVMRRVPPAYRELLDFVVNPREAARQFEQGKHWDDFLKVARSVTNSVAVLHGKGCAHSDIHYRNFLANLEPGDAVMLEMDGVVIDGFKKAEVKGLMGFMAPEILREGILPNTYTDRHSLAVLILHTLLFRNVMLPQIEYDTDQSQSDELGYGEYALFSEHPRDRRHRPRNVGRPLFDEGSLSYKMLPPRLQQLTERALIEGLRAPAVRPSPWMWEEALAVTLDELWTCDNCGQRFPYPYWLAKPEAHPCPFCGEPVGRLAVLLELYEEGRSNNFRFIERRLVLGKDSRLYADVADPQRKPPFAGREKHVLGRVEWNGSGFHLVNEEGGRWTARSLVGECTVVAEKDGSVPLVPGYCVHFGPGRRLALVASG